MMHRLIGSWLLACGQALPPEIPEGPPHATTPTTDKPDPNDDVDMDGFPASIDCDDLDAEVFPGAPERCGDGKRTDCDRPSEAGLVTVEGDLTLTDLQQAVDLAPSGGTVHICAGTYAGDVVVNRPMALIGHGAQGEVVLEGSGDGTVLVAPGDIILENLTIRGGAGSQLRAGGLMVAGDGEGVAIIRDCVIRDNQAVEGGGAYIFGVRSASLPGTQVTGNRAERGGGLYFEGGTLDLADAFISGNEADALAGGLYFVGSALRGGTIVDNRGLGTQGAGGGAGGVFASLRGEITVEDVDIVENFAEGQPGGGVRIDGPGGVVTWTGGTIAGNVSGDGGGLWARNVDLRLTNVQFFQNEEISKFTFPGGAVRVSAAELTIRSCDFGTGGLDNSPTDLSFEQAAYEVTGDLDCRGVLCEAP